MGSSTVSIVRSVVRCVHNGRDPTALLTNTDAVLARFIRRRRADADDADAIVADDVNDADDDMVADAYDEEGAEELDEPPGTVSRPRAWDREERVWNLNCCVWHCEQRRRFPRARRSLLRGSIGLSLSGTTIAKQHGHRSTPGRMSRMNGNGFLSSVHDACP